MIRTATVSSTRPKKPRWKKPASRCKSATGRPAARGASSATIKGQIKGDADVDYVVRAAAGQTLNVSLKVSNRGNYFNVLPPGSADAAMYAAQTGEPYSAMLPADGDYTIRVYLIRAAARRNEASDFTLTIGVTGKALPPLPSTQDATLPGTNYHARSTAKCKVPYDDSINGEYKLQVATAASVEACKNFDAATAFLWE